MTQVDFYILPDDKPQSRELFTCRLAEKVYKLKHRLYIHTETKEQTDFIDKLLWTYKAGSFVPHDVYQQDKCPDAPILIGHESEPPAESTVLFNLSTSVPLFFSRFDRVAEMINADEDARKQGRERFRFYKDRGYTIDSHQITAKG
jgi:DNA polymerase-3 subunit chi